MKNKQEIKVILKTLELLRDETLWDKNAVFGEECDLENQKLTLGCALIKAQKEIRGKVHNRSKEMGVVRRKIYFYYFWRAGIHPVTYFNRNRRTKYDDVIRVLQLSIQTLKT